MDFFKFLRRKSHDYTTGLFWSKGDSLGYNRTTPRDFLRYNEISLYVNRAIDTRAEKIGEVNFILRKGDEVLEDHPILDLLNRPNEFHTGKQFWKLYQKYYDITGSVFILKDKKKELFEEEKLPTALYLLRPDLVKIIYNKDNTEIDSFEYTGANGSMVKYKRDQVIYSFNPNPMSPTEGVSLLQAGVRAIETELQITEYQNNVLKNGGQVDSVFTFKGSLSEEQIKGMKDQWKANNAGSNNAGKPLFLGGEADIKRLGLNPNELSFLTSKGVTLDDISILTGVPVAVLGKTSDQTFANADASIAIFLRERIKPMLKELTTLLDWRLVPEDLDLDFIDPTPEDMDRKMKTAETLNNISALTTNEKREMFGFDSVENGDEVLIPFSLSPLKSSEDEAPEDTEAKGLSGFNHPLQEKMLRRKYGDLMVKRMDKRETMLLKLIRQYFKDQMERLLDSLGERKTFKKKDLLGELFDTELEIRLSKATILPALKAIVLETGLEAYRLVNEKPYKFVFSSEIERWLNEKASIFSNQINDTTFDKLKREFKESFEEGETRQDLIKRVQDTYGDISKGRATTIARTEVHGATTKGTIEGYKQAGMTTKIWVAVMDDVTRDSHAMVDGEEVPIDHNFSNGLAYPSDPSAPAEEVINCRCVI